VPTFEDLSSVNTPYLEAVVHETLRLSRTAGAYNRQVFEDTVILGKLIPKGTDIIFPTVTGYEDESSPIYTVPETFVPMSTAEKTHASGSAAAQLDNVRPDGASRKVGYWKAGTGRQFDPERWLDSEGRFDINSGPSLPFSLGQRGCFGKNLAVSNSARQSLTRLATRTPLDHLRAQSLFLLCTGRGRSELAVAKGEDYFASCASNRQTRPLGSGKSVARVARLVPVRLYS
jgi:cytochrome P450